MYELYCLRQSEEYGVCFDERAVEVHFFSIKKQSFFWARRKILCKRFSTKSRMALESRADSGLNPLITESHGGQNGMRAGTA